MRWCGGPCDLLRRKIFVLLVLIGCSDGYFNIFISHSQVMKLLGIRNRLKLIVPLYNLIRNIECSSPYVCPVWTTKRSDKQPTTCSLPSTIGLARETTLVDSPGSSRVAGNDTRKSIIPQEHPLKKVLR
ncbi:hypothetical protein ALC62_12032 [Cyphomyrmex costatus]|uniref:Uncharacterized protein n=1 Tax=Cyphomyrmex costatus TaxID=456900 RepID=A0A195C8V9_9HYME|nr:hypothetical protein ALC62_12032 [Cyphomyrmex costatus]